MTALIEIRYNKIYFGPYRLLLNMYDGVKKILKKGWGMDAVGVPEQFQAMIQSAQLIAFAAFMALFDVRGGVTVIDVDDERYKITVEKISIDSLSLHA